MSKHALSAISQPLALGKNTSRHQPNLFGAALVSGIPSAIVGLSFLDKFGSVAEATKEAEQSKKLRGSFSSRRGSSNLQTGFSAISLGNGSVVSESLSYKGLLSERIDNMYKKGGSQTGSVISENGSGSEGSITGNGPSKPLSNGFSTTFSPKKGPSSPDLSAASATPFHPSSTPFTPFFSSAPFPPPFTPFFSAPYPPPAYQPYPAEKDAPEKSEKPKKAPRAPRKPHVARSALLERFRADKAAKYTLPDIFGHAVEFCKDQHGSRFIQLALERASPEAREVFFNEIRPVSLELSTDVFGNYVIQKFFDHGTDIQRLVLCDNMRDHVRELAVQMYGCRVVQRALSTVTMEERSSIARELKGHVLEGSKDQNANHVVQKAVECVAWPDVCFVAAEVQDHVYHLATHAYGCRVVQRLLQYGDSELRRSILGELQKYIFYLIQDQYGNYVIQHIMENDMPEGVEEKARIFETVEKNLVTFSKHKFALNVVEKAIVCGSMKKRNEVVKTVLGEVGTEKTEKPENKALYEMMRDQYANYVVQKLVEVETDRGLKRALIKGIRECLGKMEAGNGYGKHLALIEKLIALAGVKGGEVGL